MPTSDDLVSPPPAPSLPQPKEVSAEDEERRRSYEAQRKIVQANMADYASVCRQKEMQFQLVGAIENEDEELVNALLVEGVNANAVILFTRTPLIHAVEDNHEDIAVILIQGGADVNITEKTFPYRSSVHIAALNNMVKVLQELYNNGADINTEEATAMCALHFAAWRGHQDAVNWLIKHGANPNSRDDFLRTPLHRAAEGNHYDVVKLLLYAGADINVKDRYNWTPLFHCVICNKLEMVRLLFEHGIEVNTVSNTGNTPLHAACARLRPILTKILLSVSPDPVRRKRRIPFPDFEDELTLGEFSSQFEIIEALIDAGADVNVKNNEAFTPLYLALFFGQNTKLVHFLCHAGARLSEENWLSQEIYRQVAKEKGFIETLNWLDDMRNQPQSLITQCRVCIRKCLSRDIRSKICELPLPVKLKNYLNFSEFYSDFPSNLV